jgi:hypothetical protein
MADTSRSSSPVVIENEQLTTTSYSSHLKQNHMKLNVDDDIPQNNNSQQLAAVCRSFLVHMK